MKYFAKISKLNLINTKCISAKNLLFVNFKYYNIIHGRSETTNNTFYLLPINIVD